MKAAAAAAGSRPGRPGWPRWVRGGSHAGLRVHAGAWACLHGGAGTVHVHSSPPLLCPPQNKTQRLDAEALRIYDKLVGCLTKDGKRQAAEVRALRALEGRGLGAQQSPGFLLHSTLNPCSGPIPASAYTCWERTYGALLGNIRTSALPSRRNWFLSWNHEVVSGTTLSCLPSLASFAALQHFISHQPPTSLLAAHHAGGAIHRPGADEEGGLRGLRLVAGSFV